MITALMALAVVAPVSNSESIPVKLVSEKGKWLLLREGKPYFIKGAAGNHSLKELKDAGGNSTRTWDAENIGPLLDEAHQLGMTVTVGFWLGHKEHGFDYNDPAQVKAQYDKVQAQLLKFRDHPAVLMWALGNEMEINHDVPEVWKAVGDLARMVKSLDDKHPVATIVAEIDASKIKHLKELASDVDILGINTYGGCSSLPQRLKSAGWTKPYVVTEFGPLGPWESPKTSWGAAKEASSTQKASFYKESYSKAIKSQPDWCLGSYAFLWGHKQETTPTWFGMVLPSGEQLETADVISRAWTGKWPKNRAPQIQGFGLNVTAELPIEQGIELAPSVVAVDPDGDPLTYKWEVRREVGEAKYAGEGEARPGVVAAYWNPMDDRTPHARCKVPSQPGAYRCYVYVFDGKGKAATANIPFFVKG